ncbi:outer membrane protein assembly factor BamB family protein [Cellulomonas dongxiuzhuiae]|uniref:outer membrane protein assembly factor BamB family protein n=1 Tax=Cellulomonas dongxiuzhuiae TaxID=2819979 RepID=UPI001AAECD04|nr:PQQ-binding-like beta-propeller repeat protein [Cellulomonas dongxiuzhuiae]MBO3086850.1 PQQ-binding-like beta-propeller repeat protein [Cellulomonas dongxiuzhuiae]
MGGVRPASQMRPVELVDDDDPSGTGGASARDDARARAAADATGVPGDGRRRWPWVVGALVVVVGAAAVATGVTERAAHERADAFAALPGVVRPLEQVPVERWRTVADGPTPVLSAGGAIVTVAGAQGRWTVRSWEPATGALRWEVPVVDEAGSGFESVAVACSATADPAALLLCTWTEPGVVYGGSGESTPYVPPTQVLALDPDGGEQRGTWEIEGSLLGLVRAEGDVVVATGLRDRHVLVERRDGTDGTVRWSWTSPIPLVDNGGVRAAPRLVGDDRVVGLVAMTTTLLDAGTGAVLEAGPPGRQILVTGLPDGGFATWESGYGGTLRDADGEMRARVPGLPLDVVGDASVDELLMDIGNRVVAVRPQDGVATWRLPSSMSPVAVAHGVVVMAGEGSVGAVDGADGRLLWEEELVAEQRVPPVTDGLHVLTAEPAREGLRHLVARGLRDGVEAWRLGLPSDVRQLTGIGGRLVVVTDDAVIVLA